MKQKENLKKLLNTQILEWTNLTQKSGSFDMPCVHCGRIPYIDYLASYSQPSTYFYGECTCVSFFEYDSHFDGAQGLWNAIYYGNRKAQERYLNRFRGVKYFIAPDYSKCGDVPEIENMYREFRSHVVDLWLTENTEAIVIPLVSCHNKHGMQYVLCGKETCETVAFNAKGPMGDPQQLEIFIDLIGYTVDHLDKLRQIVVYSASPNLRKVLKLFGYAIEKGIEIIVPNNMLQTRNRISGGDVDGIDAR